MSKHTIVKTDGGCHEDTHGIQRGESFTSLPLAGKGTLEYEEDDFSAQITEFLRNRKQVQKDSETES